MQSLLYQWMDLLWLPVGLVVSYKGQRLKTAAFVLICVFTLRMQIELMAETGHEAGFFAFLDAGPYERGLVVYGLVIAFFLTLVHFSPNTRGAIFLAAAISMYMMGFFISMLVMLI